MKNYTITVNGNVYDVTVEETGTAKAAAPVQKAAAPAPKAVSAPAAPAASGKEGNVKINAPMPGKILAIKAEVGQSVKKGQVIVVLEAMKMENEIVATQDGTIASINIGVNDSVEAGTLLATLN